IINGANVDLMFNQAGSTDKISVNITDGSITFTGTGKKPAAEGDFIEMYYVWNIETADDANIPSVEETIERIPVEAQPRVLSMKWSVFAEYMKKSQFGQDIRTDNVQRVLNLLYQYQVRYIIDDLCFNATGKVNGETPTITLPTSGVYNVDVTANLVMRELKKIANVIEINSGRVEGNRIVCGSNLKWFVESLPNTWFQPTPDANTGKYGFSGPREIGTFGTFKVYYDPKHAENECHMTYRGTEWYDGSYYMGEYMPAVASDAIQLGVKVRDAVCSMEAYFYHKPDCTIKFNVINQA
ncbi:MAG: hypothetical protein HUJ65_02025, partial [Oscillospiraceae bacterium]|nr:hypothetical protein [Oscillospiraceae bacterium]